MIAYTWRDRLTGAELAETEELLGACATADEEAGFSRPVLDDAPARHLLVWLLPDERWGGRDTALRRLAGYLRIDGSDGAYVVHPDCRSRGITTLLTEQLGGELPAFTIWARNHHPAAARLAHRFGVRAVRRTWQLLAPLPEAAPPGDALTASAEGTLESEHGGTVRFRSAAGEWTEYGPAARILAVRGQPVRTLLAGAMAALRDAGQRSVLLTVDSTENELVHHARTLGFRHDQTDVQYAVP